MKKYDNSAVLPGHLRSVQSSDLFKTAANRPPDSAYLVINVQVILGNKVHILILTNNYVQNHKLRYILLHILLQILVCIRIATSIQN